MRSRGRNELTTTSLLTDILQSVDRYWTATFAAATSRARVRYAWIAHGSVLTGRGVPPTAWWRSLLADDTTTSASGSRRLYAACSVAPESPPLRASGG